MSGYRNNQSLKSVYMHFLKEHATNRFSLKTTRSRVSSESAKAVESRSAKSVPNDEAIRGVRSLACSGHVFSITNTHFRAYFGKIHIARHARVEVSRERCDGRTR